jgi:hypothetical protein
MPTYPVFHEVELLDDAPLEVAARFSQRIPQLRAQGCEGRGGGREEYERKGAAVGTRRQKNDEGT